jgi:hypothetical protein
VPLHSRRKFLQETELDPHETYDSDLPDYLRYSIEWKVTLNGKATSKDTEPEVLLAPSCYWRLVLQGHLEELIQKKFPGHRAVRSNDTNAVVSVTDCSQQTEEELLPLTPLHGSAFRSPEISGNAISP